MTQGGERVEVMATLSELNRLVHGSALCLYGSLSLEPVCVRVCVAFQDGE